MPTLRKTERGRMRHQNSSPDFTMAIVLPGPRHVNRMAVVPNSTLMGPSRKSSWCRSVSTAGGNGYCEELW